jgi:heme/copper-type cytochrome/quinol oxidase subunit 2
MIAMKSEASRYLWLDWYAKWSFVDVQPSSSSRYSIIGLPFFNKNFNFTANQNDLLNETETYFLRIARARKNYFPSWTFSPYFYLKNHLWFPKSNFSVLSEISNLNLDLLQLTFNHELNLSSSNSKIEWQPTFSTTSLYAKSFESSLINEIVLINFLTNLYDILSKREYAYKQFSQNQITTISNYPTNALLNDFKNLIYTTRLTNNSTFPSSSYFNLNKLEHSWIQPLMKNQYRPLRKGINNMLRLHATGAIAMPIEIRLQILASSKDVIHSWAIPSAGIKIDCVPGYSSHRITIFLVSGIFWGQCMEICGRYHHWMPIVVYFMKRDLFFLWCTHFIISSSARDASTAQTNFYTANKGVVSFNKLSWLVDM